MEPCINTGFLKAGNETRTHDPFITSEVLYRLSYSSLCYTQMILYTILRKIQLFFTNSVLMILKVASATALSYGHPLWLKDLVMSNASSVSSIS